MTMEHNDRLKQRLVGAAVLISLVVVFLPMLVERGPEPTAGREAVSPRPEWKVAGWQGGEYRAPVPADGGTQSALATVAADGDRANTVTSGGRGNEAVVPPTAESDATTPATTITQEPATKPADLIEATVKKGDTLYGIFRRHGIATGQVPEVIKLLGRVSNLRPGQAMRFRVDDKGRIKAMEYRYGRGDPLRIKRIAGRLQVAGDVSALRGGQSHKSAVATRSVKPSRPIRPIRPTREQGPVAWVVKVGVYKDLEAARVLQAKLRNKHYPAFVTKSKGKDGHISWSLKVGPKVKKSDAQVLAKKVEQVTGTKTTVVSHR